ncbi:hypothetical protein Y032_0054g2477 [Ancylostoma ceylanicum]|uniref:Unspecific monooxygenase n=1 Tax=Ancylostoma ceylanicum TaxID=53326 RepID=A0A016U6U2_9BILA|nr:hypothetical protein Y032_0054g2477 [Ancylostoma ceylanicum]
MIVLALVVGLTSFLFMRTWLQRRKLPPGPFPLPLIGNLHQLVYAMFACKKTFVEAISDFAKKYGSVHTFWFGPMPTVNICDYATAVDAMVKKGSAFADRNVPYMFTAVRGNRGIIVSNGPLWQEQRRFALHTLRNFGMGRNIIEERIMYEFEITCEELEKRLNAGEASIDPDKMFDLLVGNIINRMLFTDRFEKKDEQRFFALKEKMDKSMENFSMFDMLLFAEWSEDLPLIRSRKECLLKPFDDVINFIRGQIDQRKKDIANSHHIIEGEGTDFVDAFLLQMKNEENSGNLSSFDEEWLVMTLLDLWSAGMETTKITLNWAFSFLLLYPEVKSRLEEELLSVTKGQRDISIKDRQLTPYFNAVLTEVHRCAMIVPLSMWRDTSEDTVVGEFLIPKGTAISAQISVIMNDEKYFKDNHEFNPDRYLTEDKIDHMVVSFGLGKRACPGESLAQAELYLIIANLLLRFEVTLDEEHLPSMQASQEKPGALRIAKPYHIHFKKRVL